MQDIKLTRISQRVSWHISQPASGADDRLGSKSVVGRCPIKFGSPPESGEISSCVIAVGLRSANNGRRADAAKSSPVFSITLGRRGPAGAGPKAAQRRDQLFSSRLSSLKKRQSVPCSGILLGVDLMMSRFSRSSAELGRRKSKYQPAMTHIRMWENSESRAPTRDRLWLPWSNQ